MVVLVFRNVTLTEGTCSSSKSANTDLITGKTIRKLTLPSILSSANGETTIEGLLQACAPATFGNKGDEVLDETYRKAVKLDSNQFSTSFIPYEVGIIETIAQSLLPGIAKPFFDGKSKYEEHLGVIAELYKLNVSLTKTCVQQSLHYNDTGALEKIQQSKVLPLPNSYTDLLRS